MMMMMKKMNELNTLQIFYRHTIITSGKMLLPEHREKGNMFKAKRLIQNMGTVVVGFYDTFLTSQVISVASDIEREKSDKLC